jgi:hypothetical protein
MIPEEIVEETWKEVGRYSPDKAVMEMIVLRKKQPALLAFIRDFTRDLAGEVKELSLYMFLTIYRMFEKSSDKVIPLISSEKIIKVFESNDKLIQSMDVAHEKFFNRIAQVQFSKQPYILKYIVEALVEETEDEVELSDESVSCLFLLLITVVDLLDMKV